MGLLDGVRTGKRQTPRRTLLYGVGGVGKSTWAAQSDSPIFLDLEDGLAGIDCHSIALSSYDEVLDCLRELYKAEHSYRTIVIDSLDWLEQLIWRAVCKDHSKGSIEEFGYGKGYVLALDFWRKIVEGLEALRKDCHFASILIAHSKVEKFESPESDSYDRYSPRLHKNAAAFICEWCDEVLFANHRTYVQTTEEGFNRTRARGVGTGERLVWTVESPARVAKNRLGLPEELPLEFNAYRDYFVVDREPQQSARAESSDQHEEPKRRKRATREEMALRQELDDLVTQLKAAGIDATLIPSSLVGLDETALRGYIATANELLNGNPESEDTPMEHTASA